MLHVSPYTGGWADVRSTCRLRYLMCPSDASRWHAHELLPRAAQVLHANLAQAGSAKTLPYLVMFVTSNAGGWAGDYLIASRRASVAGARKAVNSVGALPACCGVFQDSIIKCSVRASTMAPLVVLRAVRSQAGVCKF